VDLCSKPKISCRPNRGSWKMTDSTLVLDLWWAGATNWVRYTWDDPSTYLEIWIGGFSIYEFLEIAHLCRKKRTHRWDWRCSRPSQHGYDQWWRNHHNRQQRGFFFFFGGKKASLLDNTTLTVNLVSWVISLTTSSKNHPYMYPDSQRNFVLYQVSPAT